MTDGEVSHEATLGENELSSAPVNCCRQQCESKSSITLAKGLSEILLPIGEGEDATTKGECEAVVVELHGITPGDSSLAVSQSTEMSDWDNIASMTEADSHDDVRSGVNAAEDTTPLELARQSQ